MVNPSSAWPLTSLVLQAGQKVLLSFIHFSYLISRDRQRAPIHWFTNPNPCNSLGWAGTKSGAKNVGLSWRCHQNSSPHLLLPLRVCETGSWNQKQSRVLNTGMLIWNADISSGKITMTLQEHPLQLPTFKGSRPASTSGSTALCGFSTSVVVQLTHKAKSHATEKVEG